MSCEVLDSEAAGPAPFSRVVPVGWYDGPTEGVLECGGVPYVFRKVAWDRHFARRVFVLRPVSRGAFDAVAEIVGRPADASATDEERQATWERLMDLLDQGGPVEYLVMADWITEALLAVRRVDAPALRAEIEAMILPTPGGDDYWDGFSYSDAPHERWLELLLQPEPAAG
ncbi:MAG TPA: hypothetical protein VFJ82_25280 [Longimicrobium sp.]|nr:hypothetical protein [Longimicrobium sp.]